VLGRLFDIQVEPVFVEMSNEVPLASAMTLPLVEIASEDQISAGALLAWNQVEP
jgi:hypothetical protein